MPVRFAKCATGVMVPAVVMALLVLSPSSVRAADYQGAMIDTHAQYDRILSSEEMMSLVCRAGLSGIFISARGKRTNRDILTASQKYPDTLIPAIRTKGKSSHKFLQAMKRAGRSGQFYGLQELLLHHAEKVSRSGKKMAPEVIQKPESALIRTATEIARTNGWPVPLHYEFKSMSAKSGAKYRTELESFLTENRDLSFTLLHMGELDAPEVEKLIADHPNIFFHLSWTANAARATTQPFTFMFKKNVSSGVLKPQWKRLLETHPDRFLLAFDGVFVQGWRKFYVPQVREWRAALGTLPRDAADLIAHGNALRLWPALRRHPATASTPSASIAKICPSLISSAKKTTPLAKRKNQSAKPGRTCRDGNISLCRKACKKGIQGACRKLKQLGY